ncbi:MAG: hypothetical protein ACLTDF_09930 [Coprococcus sp.]
MENMEDTICPRDIFGSHDDADHVYNTRGHGSWSGRQPNSAVWDLPDADFTLVSMTFHGA